MSNEILKADALQRARAAADFHPPVLIDMAGGEVVAVPNPAQLQALNKLNKAEAEITAHQGLEEVLRALNSADQSE